MAIIFVWVSRNLFHIGWNGNYELWVLNPIAFIPIADGIWDPHFASGLNSDYTIVLSSGIYNWLYTLGFNSVFHLYNFVIMCELLAVISIPLGKLHLIYNEELLHWLRLNKPAITSALHKEIKHSVLTSHTTYFDLVISYKFIRCKTPLEIIIPFLSIAWSGHLLDYAIPISTAVNVYWLNTLRLPSLKAFYYPFDSNALPILTFLGGLKSNTISLYLTDIAHHHLGVGILFVWVSHLYLSFYKGFGHRIGDVFVNGNSGPILRPLAKSLQLQLSQGLAASSIITSLLAQQMYSLTPYLYLSYDYIRVLALYLHHSWIASFLMMGTFGHGSIFLIRDWDSSPIRLARQHLIGRIWPDKGAIISHLSWICLWLGLHILGVYIHNDTAFAFCEQEKQILIEPIFATNFQSISVAATITTHIPLRPGDLLAHHAIALGLHLSILILFKGSLDGTGSKLMPDKIHFGYGFPCDGPGRGGTCDISAWDSFYLATFWMVNTGAWITFYFHWKHLTLWLFWSLSISQQVYIAYLDFYIPSSVATFDESSTYLNGWFRDYLWFNSTPLIHGYNTFGANDLSIWAWAFLAAHLCWASGFMFLISWRGYWQELIDIILYMHLKTPILYNLWNGDIYTPVALSIVQARFVGLVHFSTGFILTYTAFIIGATS